MMSTHSGSSSVGAVSAGTVPIHAGSATKADRVARVQSQQRTGDRLILAGFVVTVVGVILYCVACFAGGVDASLAAILFDNVVPFARATLVVLGIGSALWLVGSFMYLNATITEDEIAGADASSTGDVEHLDR
ncbi:MAG: hypothetical protein U0587_05670 [Candidatus Binatia bacterium]